MQARLEAPRRVSRLTDLASAGYDFGQPSWFPSTENSFTLLMLVRKNGIAVSAGRRLWTTDAVGFAASQLSTNGDSQNLRLVINRSTDTSYNTGTGNILLPDTDHRWMWLLVTANSSAGTGSKVQFYRRIVGDRAEWTSFSPTVSTEGSGTVNHYPNSACHYTIGSNNAAAVGGIDFACVHHFTQSMSATQINSIFTAPDADLFNMKLIVGSNTGVRTSLALSCYPGSENAPGYLKNLQSVTEWSVPATNPPSQLIATDGFMEGMGNFLVGGWDLPVVSNVPSTAVTGTVAVDVSVGVDASLSEKIPGTAAIDVSVGVDASASEEIPGTAAVDVAVGFDVTGTVKTAAQAAIDVTVAVDAVASEEIPGTAAIDVTVGVDASGTVTGGTVTGTVDIGITPSVDVVLSTPVRAGGRTWIHEELPAEPKKSKKKKARRAVENRVREYFTPVEAQTAVGIVFGVSAQGRMALPSRASVAIPLGMEARVWVKTSLKEDEAEIDHLMEIIGMFPTD